MKLKKINPDHFVIVDGSEIKEGDYYWNQLDKAVRVNNTINHPYHQKITHSTQPLGIIHGENGKETIAYGSIGYISLSEVKELIGEVDVERKAEMLYPFAFGGIGNIENDRKRHWIKGYAQALEDNKEKKYTEEDMRKAIEMARQKEPYKHDGKPCGYLFQDATAIIQSLQPPTEWEVEFVEGKLKLK